VLPNRTRIRKNIVREKKYLILWFKNTLRGVYDQQEENIPSIEVSIDPVFLFDSE
jgi:hypothetical protein